MLIKSLTLGKDYEKTLKTRQLIAAALLVVGLVGEVCYFLLVDGSDLPNFAQGFYMGAASGICLAAVYLLCRTRYLLTHPDQRQKAKVQETDERAVAVTNAAFRVAGYVTFFASAAALFVALPLSLTAFWALMGVVVLYAAVFFISHTVLDRRM